MAFSIIHADARYTDDGGVAYIYRFLIDSDADLTDVPGDALPGSEAITADGTYAAMMGNDGTWVEQNATPVVEEG